MKTAIKYLTVLVLIVGVATLFYKRVYIPKTTFKTLHPSVSDLEVSVRGIGNVGAETLYTITAQTGGKILSLYVDEGEWVKRGDLLLKMDGVDLPQQLEVLKATLEKTGFDIKVLQNELANQKAQKRLLEITLKRFEKLKEQKFAAESEFDKASADLEGMEANIRATLARIDSTQAAAKITMKNIDAMRAKIERLSVYAPADGYVISKNVEIAQSVLLSTPLLSIVDAKTLWVQTKINERVSSQIEVGQEASIELRSQEGRLYKGVVKRIESISDAVTLEREIDVAFVKIPKPFYINEQAEVKIVVKNFKNVLTIPSKLLVQRGGKIGVWLLKESRAKFIEVEKIAQNDALVAVKNLTKESEIILPDAKKKPLHNGMQIHL